MAAEDWIDPDAMDGYESSGRRGRTRDWRPPRTDARLAFDYLDQPKRVEPPKRCTVCSKQINPHRAHRYDTCNTNCENVREEQDRFYELEGKILALPDNSLSEILLSLLHRTRK